MRRGRAGKTRVALADLSLLLPALSGHADMRADLGGSTAALHLAGDLQAGVAVRNAAPGTVTGPSMSLTCGSPTTPAR